MERRRALRAGRRLRLADRLRSALAEGHGRPLELLAGDGLPTALAPGEAPHEAAVLVAVTDRPEPGVILTRRPETMRRHPGQVAFPGGRVDPADTGVIAAALREAEEEIALPRHMVEVVGLADRYLTVTGYAVTPVLGVIPPDLPLVPHDAEVAAIFEVPLAHLLAPDQLVRRTIDWRGRPRAVYEILWGGERIWGATAAMIVNLARRLDWPR